MSGESDATREKKRIAIQLLALGRSYRQISSTLGVGKSTISDWVNKDKAFQEALEVARATQNENQAEVLDAYKMALFRAAEEAGNCVTTLVAIANNPETRSSDRLKAIEMLFGRADKLMAFLEQEARFPQEIVQEKELERQRESIWKLELQAAGWKESYPHSGSWVNPIDGLEYDIEVAYRQLQSHPIDNTSKKIRVEELDTRLVNAVAQVLQKISGKAAEKDISLDELKQVSMILRNLKAVAMGDDVENILLGMVNHELMPWDALLPILDAIKKGDESMQWQIKEILQFNGKN